MEDKRNKGIGLAGTIAFHALLIGLLAFFGFSKVEQQDEEGILVMVGVADGADVGAASQPDPEPQPVMPEPQPESTPPPPATTPEVKQEVVTQDHEESLKLAEADKKAREEKERLRKEEEKRRKEAEEKRRIEEERKKKEEAIRNRVNNVFQSASKTGTQGTASEGTTSSKGNPFGNSDTGAQSGSPGYGSYDLGGRGIQGSLPRPSFSVNESGKVVVSITVDESGKVIAAGIGQGTTTTSAQLRQSALTAARKAVFETKSGTISQSGTITYHFDSDN
ncbi:MAG: energy transducer TonB [Bacteroidales bacterium]